MSSMEATLGDGRSRTRGPRAPGRAALTFLFSDVEGSTRLLQQLGDEQYGAAIAMHDRLLREAFTRGGGHEVDSQGDSFFFVFMDAIQAAHAAVEAQRALAAERPQCPSLKVRIGLHTGKASLLARRPVGLAVHRAARIADAAHGGQILLSGTTADIVAETAPFRLRALGEHRLKDLERPLRLYQIVADGLEADFPPVRGLSPGSPAAITGRPAGGFGFVGRERELGMLRQVLQDVLSGTGRIALLEGEAGIGKTRLALELGHVAAEHGIAVVSGTSVEGGAAPTLWPWLEIVRAVVDQLEPEAEEALSPHVAALVTTPTDPTALTPISADARFVLYKAVAHLLQSAASRRPLLVFLDDIQWADTPSLELLQTLALEIVAMPLFLVAAYREYEPGAAQGLEKALAAVVRCPWTRRVVVRGLPRDAVRHLIRDAAVLEPPPELAAVVHARTQGNPFFVSELVRLVAAEPELGLDALSTRIPLSVRDVVRRRLQALPAETQELLQLAGVIGNAFEFRLLAKASGADARVCAERLEPALATRTVVEAQEDDFRFSHGLVRETMVEDLTPLRRAQLHASVAGALLGVDAVSDDLVEIVADHVWHARQLVEPAPAAAALGDAAGVALRRHAYDTAERLLEQALEVTSRLPAGERDDAEQRLELSLASLRMMTQGYSVPAVLAGFDRAAEIARRSGNLAELVKSLHGTASGLGVSGRFRDSLQVARACLAAAVELDNPLALALGHHIVGIGHLHLGDIGAARQDFRACVDACEASHLGATEAFDIAVPAGLAGPVFAAVAEYLGGDAEAAESFHERAITIAEELDTPFGWQVAMFFSGWLAALRDDPQACRAYMARGQEAVGEHVFPVFAAASPPMLTWALGRLGDEEAAERLDGILRRLDALGVRALSHFFHGLRADLLADRGDVEAALSAFEESIAVSDAIEERFYLAELRRRRGELLLRSGREDAGQAELLDALRLARDQGAGAFERRIRETLSRPGARLLADIEQSE
jgi:class 3 adenylate cyclase/tetratricopeptide (TPR) repeat protein